MSVGRTIWLRQVFWIKYFDLGTHRFEQSSRFVHPVFAGDTLYSALEVIELVPGRTTGVLTMKSSVVNQAGVLVLDGKQKYLIRKRTV